MHCVCALRAYVHALRARARMHACVPVREYIGQAAHDAVDVFEFQNRAELEHRIAAPLLQLYAHNVQDMRPYLSVQG